MRIKTWLTAIAGSFFLLSGSIGAQQPAAPVPEKVAVASPDSSLHELTKADVDSWLGGLIPYSLEAGDIAGGVIVVVKDGQILTARGFGRADQANDVPVDPDRTLFRPGSVSKLFTWTALMQLIEAGKVNLNDDVNKYLDFKIPAAFGKPITVRDLMTHTPGFEESVKYLIVTDPKATTSLERGLKRWTPTRIYAPGTTPAYSNYGAAMAGYIVQRVSGESFENYIQHNIFDPLAMKSSTFEQHLPPRLAAEMSKGYDRASGDPKAFERLDLGPAGALSATGTDMGRFMIAHLDNGKGLMRPETAQLMHSNIDRPIPGLPAMGLGFYHEDRDGLNIVGHGGDTNWFHSDLHLYLDQGVGIYMSFNSLGKDRAAYPLRQAVFNEFTYRYMADAGPAKPTDPDARRYADAVTGTWIMSRGAFTTWVSLASVLQPLTVARNSDDTISVSALHDSAGNIRKWRAIGPWLWQDVNSTELLGVRVENGKPVAMSIAQIAPIIIFLRAPFSMDGTWIMPVLGLSAAVILLTALSWPIVALIRRRYGYVSPVGGRDLKLHRASRVAAWLWLAVLVGWTLIVSMIDTDVSVLDGQLDPLMRGLQLLTLLGILGTIAAIANIWFTFKRAGAGWFTKFWVIAFAFAALFFCWFLINFHTLNASLQF